MSYSSKFKVVGLGELLWDMLPDGPRMGGAPANFAYHSHELGADAEIVSCVGEDKLGKALIQQLKLKGLSVKYISFNSQRPTGTVTVQLDSQGHPSYQIHEEVAWDYIPWAEETELLAQKTDAVCFGTLAQRSTISRDTIQRFLSSTRTDCLKICDINLRQSYFNRDIIEKSLSLSNILKLNEEELPVVCQLLSIHGAQRDLLSQLLEKYKLQYIALTRGSRGSLMAVPGVIYYHDGFPLEKVVDTVGAGDSFTAAMVMGLLNKDSVEKILENANKLAAYVCTQPGAMPSHPTKNFQS